MVTPPSRHSISPSPPGSHSKHHAHSRRAFPLTTQSLLVCACAAARFTAFAIRSLFHHSSRACICGQSWPRALVSGRRFSVLKASHARSVLRSRRQSIVVARGWCSQSCPERRGSVTLQLRAGARLTACSRGCAVTLHCSRRSLPAGALVGDASSSHLSGRERTHAVGCACGDFSPGPTNISSQACEPGPIASPPSDLAHQRRADTRTPLLYRDCESLRAHRRLGWQRGASPACSRTTCSVGCTRGSRHA